MKYYYMLFNHTIESDISILEADAIDSTEQVDIKIEVGNPPDWVVQAVKNNQVDHIEDQVMWFRVKKKVVFFVENGNHIIIYKEKEAEEMPHKALCSYLIGSAMTLALIQRRYLPIHGGVVSYNGKGVMISGASGSGKSTVAVALREKGFLFVTDDVAPVFIEDNNVMVLPGVPQQKICRDLIKKFDLNENDLIYIDEDRDKFAWPLEEGYIKKPIPVAFMINLYVSKTETQIRWEEVRGGEKLHQLMNNIYRGEVYQRLSYSPERMTMFLDIAVRIPMYRIIRPEGKDALEEIIKCIKSNILQIS